MYKYIYAIVAALVFIGIGTASNPSTADAISVTLNIDYGYPTEVKETASSDGYIIVVDAVGQDDREVFETTVYYVSGMISFTSDTAYIRINRDNGEAIVLTINGDEAGKITEQHLSSMGEQDGKYEAMIEEMYSAYS